MNRIYIGKIYEGGKINPSTLNCVYIYVYYIHI